MRTLLPDIGKNAAMVLPPTRYLYRRLQQRRGYDTAKDDASYPLGVFRRHAERVQKVRPIGGDVLEIGPGGNLAAAALFVAHGADSAVCLDVDPLVRERPELYARLGISDALDRVRYVAPATIEAAPFPDRSFDIIFSHASFEHFADPGRAIDEIARLLRPGGVTTHVIDLRDHRDFDHPTDFLRYRDFTWRLAGSHRHGHTNRWRASDILEHFVASGLEIVEVEKELTIEIDEAAAATFAPPYRYKRLDDLGTLGIVLTAARAAD
jgi:SAM-dependent methyltransferase